MQNFFQEQRGLYRLGVSPKDSNLPVALYINASSPMSERMFHIRSIDPSPPPSSAFNIPPACPQSLKPQHVPPMIILPFMMANTGNAFKNMP